MAASHFQLNKTEVKLSHLKYIILSIYSKQKWLHGAQMGKSFHVCSLV